MIVDVYNWISKNPKSNMLMGDDYLLVEYKCPINIEDFQLWTDMHLISFVINGRKDWISNGKIYPLRAGDALFVKKGVYVTKQYLDVEYCVILFFINDTFIKKFLHANKQSLKASVSDTSNDDQIFEIHVNPSFEALMMSMFSYLTAGGELPRNLLELKFQELLFNIALNPNNRPIHHFFASLQQTKETDLADVMLRNFQYDLQLTEFARLCGRSLSSFKRDFKKHFQETPGRWLNNKRLEHARSLLSGSDLSVSEICYECGFKNRSHFTTAFKEKYQLPPNQYKKQLLEN